jgi:ribosomal protein S18 acetylase RimI-like enzyme
MARKSKTVAKLDIRPYRQDDRDAVVALWEVCELTRPWNDPDQDIALLGETPSAEILVGAVRGKIAATVMVGHDGHRGWVYYLAVDPASRGRGFGAAIMRAAEVWLVERGVAKIQIMVREHNLAVKKFYAAIGYQPNPCHLMQRWLDGREAPGIETDRDDGKLETTITYLEMTERPPHPHLVPPHGMKLALLRARPPTVAFYRFLYDTVGGPWLWYERRALDDEALGRIITDDQVEIYVLYANGVPAGYAELDRRDPPDIELAYFGLMPDFIGKGLGRYLLTWAIDTAWSYEPERLWVNTNSLDHSTALALYQRCGFRPYRQEHRVIDDPRLIGLIPV